jgi:hypothetical protein
MVAEKVKEEDEASSLQADSTRRERSKIGFPYGDLDDAIAVAKAIFEHGGQQGTLDQLAAWLKHDTVESGAFKIKILTARMFGVVQSDGDTVSLTDLGNQIVDPKTEQVARAQAFLRVPLYRAIYEKYKGRMLPGDAALEAEMITLGVAPKQKARARQGFQRSAEQAKLFAQGKDRLVLPGGVSLDSKPSNGGTSRKMETPATHAPIGDLNPVLSVLLESLPPEGAEWPRDARQQWMQILERALDRLYKDKAE